MSDAPSILSDRVTAWNSE